MRTRDPVNQAGFDAQAEAGPTTLGPLSNWHWLDDPKRFLFSLSRYKQVSRLFLGRREVLEIGCGDAFGSTLVAQAVEHLTVSDFDPLLISEAERHMNPRFPFDTLLLDITTDEPPFGFDGVYALDVLEHIPEEIEDQVLARLCRALLPNGALIIGMPSLESQVHASTASKEGHVNCMTGNDLRLLMARYFSNVFVFGMNDEVLHTGFYGMSHYLLGLGCGKRA